MKTFYLKNISGGTIAVIQNGEPTERIAGSVFEITANEYDWYCNSFPGMFQMIDPDAGTAAIAEHVAASKKLQLEKKMKEIESAQREMAKLKREVDAANSRAELEAKALHDQLNKPVK